MDRKQLITRLLVVCVLITIVCVTVMLYAKPTGAFALILAITTSACVGISGLSILYIGHHSRSVIGRPFEVQAKPLYREDHSHFAADQVEDSSAADLGAPAVDLIDMVNSDQGQPSAHK